MPANIYFGPTPSYFPHKPPRIASCYDRAISLDTDFVGTQKSKEFKRRRLPNIEQLTFQSSQNRSLPMIPSDERAKQIENSCIAKFDSRPDMTKQQASSFEYYGYDSGGSDAETTIHISIEKQHSYELFKSDISKLDTTDKLNITEEQKETSEYEHKYNRKKFLSLDLRTSYEGGGTPIQTKSLDLCKTEKIDVDPTDTLQTDNTKELSNIPKSKTNTSNRRRFSESSATLKSSITTWATPDKTEDIFKMVSRKSISGPDMPENENSSPKKQNVVSINEIPTFQEYRSPNSNSPQSSIDLSIKKPLPSIIKKARYRSNSVAATNHIDREFSYVANYMSIALSPPNLGSNRRALTPVASHLPLDVHDNTLDNTDDTESVDLPPELSPFFDEPPKRRESVRTLPATPKHAKRDKPSRRGSKRSNEYGGRENGRSNHQPQPLERRESRRNQFTRSLSNADVPPDEKAGKQFYDYFEQRYLPQLPLKPSDMLL